MQQSSDVQRRDKEFFATWSPAQERFALSDVELDAVVAMADVLIPADGTWPVPSSTELRFYVERGARRQSDVRLLQALVRRACEASPTLDPGELAHIQAQIQRSEPVAFRCLLEFVYYGYYAQPEVVRTIREALNCDYISPPQPRGYHMEFDTDIRPRTVRPFRPTAQVERLDVSKIDFAERS